MSDLPQADQTKQYKPILLAGHLYFILFLVFASVFYLERTLLADPVSQIFELINTKSYVIFTGRYTMALPTTLPLLAVWLGMPLKVIHFLYSISIPLISWVIYCIVVYRLKNIASGILICFTLAVTSHTFFHSISETTQLIAYGALFIAWLEFRIRNNFSPFWPGFAITLLVTAILLFIHPVAIFVWAFSLGYVTIKYRLFRHRFPYVHLLVFVVLIIVKTVLTGSGSHDASFIPEQEELLYQIQHLNTNFPWQFFKNAFSQNYLLPAFFLVATTVHYLFRKNWLLPGFQVIFIVAAFIISLVVYHKPDGYFAMERIFLPFLFFTGYPFLREILITPSGKGLATIKALAILAFVSYGFYKIASVATIFQNRLGEVKFLVESAQKLPGDKFYVPKEYADFCGLPIPYNIASETLLYSTMMDTLRTVTIYMDQGEMAQFDEAWNRSHRYLFTNYYPLRDDRELNSDYFSLKGPYAKLLPGVISGDTTTINSSFENYIADKGYTTSVKEVFFSGPPPDSGIALDGNSSLVLASPETPYAVNYQVTSGHGILKCEVSVKGNDQCSIVIAGENNEPYLRFFPGPPGENGWAKISANITIKTKDSLKLYLWNPQEDSAYFDDLTIQILQ